MLALLGNNQGNKFGRGWSFGWGIAPAPAGTRAGVHTMLYVVSSIRSQVGYLCPLLTHVNVVNVVT